jgi:hypothetical protein
MAATASVQGQVGVTPVQAAHTIPVLALGMSHRPRPGCPFFSWPATAS